MKLTRKSLQGLYYQEFLIKLESFIKWFQRLTSGLLFQNDPKGTTRTCQWDSSKTWTCHVNGLTSTYVSLQLLKQAYCMSETFCETSSPLLSNNVPMQNVHYKVLMFYAHLFCVGPFQGQAWPWGCGRLWTMLFSYQCGFFGYISPFSFDYPSSLWDYKMAFIEKSGFLYQWCRAYCSEWVIISFTCRV